MSTINTKIKKSYVTKNKEETEKIGEQLAVDIARSVGGNFQRRKNGVRDSAIILALRGNLGAGKTTFLRGMAKGLGVRENVLSPTFILMRRFSVVGKRFKNFYHIDCYRLSNPKELLELGFEDIISNPENIVAIEWSERVRKILPKKNILVTLRHRKGDERTLTIVTNDALRRR